MRLKQLRLEKDVSQTELAKVLNTSQNSISNYEQGNTEPNLKSLVTLANYFNVSLDYLCERPFNNQIGYIPEDRKELVKMILELDASDINEISALIRGYKAGKSGNTNFKIFN